MNSSDNPVVELQDRMTSPEIGFKVTPVKFAADAFIQAQDLIHPHHGKTITVVENYVKLAGPTQAMLASIVVEKGHEPRLVVMPLNAQDVRTGKHTNREPQSFALSALAAPGALDAALALPGEAPAVVNAAPVIIIPRANPGINQTVRLSGISA